MMDESSPPCDDNWEHHEAIVHHIRLHWVEAKPSSLSDPPAALPPTRVVILLHGFPEFWYSWRHQLRALSKAGYRVIAPDLRGYNWTEKAATGYDLNTLSQDVAELIKMVTGSESSPKVCLIGHDWGGVVAWAVAQRFPECISQLIILGAPLIQDYAHKKLTFSQLVKSYYVACFQLPWLPELLLGAFRGWFLVQAMIQTQFVPGSMNDSLPYYREAMGQPGALPCMLSYYRSARTSVQQAVAYGRVQAPVLILWGERDAFLGNHLPLKLDEYLANPCELVYLPCGHWIQQELPDEVNRHIITFLNKRNEFLGSGNTT